MPNPNQGRFTISHKNNIFVTISIVNSLGIEVYNEKVRTNESITMPYEWASGIYYVKITDQNNKNNFQKMSIIK